MVSWALMESKPTNRGGRIIHGVRLSDAEWDALQGLAGALGCHHTDGSVSVSRMLVELTRGTLVLVRTRESEPRSRAELIRAAIADQPAATDSEIAKQTAEPTIYVKRVRERMAGKP